MQFDKVGMDSRDESFLVRVEHAAGSLTSTCHSHGSAEVRTEHTSDVKHSQLKEKKKKRVCK